MKLSPFLLAGSLAANAALVAVLLFRPAPAASPPSVGARDQRQAAPTGATDAPRADALLAALASGDSAAMTAAGVPLDVVRQLAAARAFGRLAAVARATERPDPAGPYWRNSRSHLPPPSREQRAERTAAEREFERAMREAFGDTWNDEWRGGRYSFLPAERQELLRRIERDYEDMRRELAADAGDVQLPSDREKQRLLTAEMERDLAAALTPAERAEIERRSSPSARAIIDQFGDLLASEDEYKQLYALRKAFDDRYNVAGRPRTPEEERQRAEAERTLNDHLRAALGDERWGAVSRGSDREYQTLGTLTARLGLPAATPDLVYAVRESFAAQSLALHQDATLADAERRRQITALAGRARDELRAKLGPEGAEAYLPHSGWVQALQRGAAFVTQPRLLPPGSARPPAHTTAYPLPTPKR